ncbi:MAG: hypothetical protein ACYTGC_00080 [Planctomycetota bacterium]|jgi:hypothetical protein
MTRAHRIGAALVGLLLVVAPLTATTQPGGDSALQYIWPRLDRETFARYCAELGLEQQQPLIAELAFADYSSALRELVEETDDDADRAGRREVAEALAGRRRLPPDELRRRQTAVLRTYRSAWERSDPLLFELLDAVEGLLTPEQAPRVRRARADLERDLWLVPMRERRRMQDYAGDGLDLVALARRALEEGGELVGVDATLLDAVLESYAMEMAAVLHRTGPAERALRLDARIARIERDDDAQRRLDGEAVQLWQVRYVMNNRLARRIGDLAARSLGADAQSRWRRRFERAAFPWLLDRRPDRIMRWLEQEDILSTDKLRDAQSRYRRYVVEREPLAREAMTQIIEGRT